MEILIIILLSILIFAAATAAVLLKKRNSAGKAGETQAVLEERIRGYETERTRLVSEAESRKDEIEKLNQSLSERERTISSLERDLALSRKDLEKEIEQGEEKLRLLKEAREELGNHFKVLANSILEEKTKSFAESSKTGLGEILNPLKEKLGEFQKKIQENYETEGKERHSLRNEVHKLMEMNDRLSKEAVNLTNALKGESKTQGNWGEMILERILEVSGLRKGEEYTVQESHSLDGGRLQPDVVIHLPEDRHLVIDSKVSLKAYEEYMSLEDPERRSEALKRHVASIRTHIKGLASKEYEKLHDEKSPDFVVLFIPIEPAYVVAVSEESKLWEEAWKNNILLVCPSTLLPVMWIVMQHWRQEYRGRNAKEIAKRGAALYEKIVGFIQDFEDVGRHIERTQSSFENAKTKLSSGRGNVIRQAEMLKELGISTAKSLPEEYVEDAQAGNPQSERLSKPKNKEQPFLQLEIDD